MERAQTKNHWMNKRVMGVVDAPHDLDASILYLVTGTDWALSESNQAKLQLRLLPLDAVNQLRLGTEYVYAFAADVYEV